MVQLSSLYPLFSSHLIVFIERNPVSVWVCMNVFSCLVPEGCYCFSFLWFFFCVHDVFHIYPYKALISSLIAIAVNRWSGMVEKRIVRAHWPIPSHIDWSIHWYDDTLLCSTTTDTKIKQQWGRTSIWYDGTTCQQIRCLMHFHANTVVPMPLWPGMTHSSEILLLIKTPFNMLCHAWMAKTMHKALRYIIFNNMLHMYMEMLVEASAYCGYSASNMVYGK